MVENGNIENTVAEATPPTYEELETQFLYHKGEHNRLQNLVDYYQTRNRDYATEFNRKVSSLEYYLDEHWDELGDHAEEIAGFFDIQVTKDVQVTITVEYDITLSVPRNVADDVSEYDFGFDDFTYTGEGEMENGSFNVSHFEANPF